MDAKEVNVKLEDEFKVLGRNRTTETKRKHNRINDLFSISQIFPNGHPEIVKAIKEKPSKATQRKLRSKVWDHFDGFEEDENQVAKCKHCPNMLTGSSKSGTTHLNSHSKVCPGKKKQNQESQLILPVDTNEGSLRFDKKRSHMDLAKMMIKLRCPLDMAEQETFKNFVKGLQPMLEFQSKDILSYIHRIYDEEKEKLQLYFDKLASKFNLTVSLCKNNAGKTTYCCLISHFIDDGWELKRKILALKTSEHINDTKALGENIRSLVLEWNISNKICSITVDNSFLNDSMVDQIKEICLSDQGSVSSDHWFITFTLLEDGFREMDGILFKLSKSIEYVTETRHGKLKLQEAVDQVKLQGGKLWDDLSFRLESDFDILDSALRSREIFCELENAVALQSCLKCFDDIKGTQCLPVSLYFPKLCDAYKKFLQLEKNSHSFVTLMKRKFDRYWSLCNLALAVASVLDPRVIYGHDSKMRLNMFHKVLRDVYYEYASEAKYLTTSASALFSLPICKVSLVFWSEIYLVVPEDVGKICRTSNDSILDSLSKFTSASNFNEEASWKLELELYLDEPLLPMDGAFFDILGWWCDKSQRFPILAKMAQDFLAIPVSISTSCSNISDPASSSLNPEIMEALVCCENWLETPKERKRPWCEQDIKVYLLSRFTKKEHKRLDKWQRNELNGYIASKILAPLLMVPQSDETRKEYYINDSVVNAFFELLKKRYDKFPNTYINHYSFDSQIAAQLIQGSRSEHEVLIWFKAEKLRGVHKLFLPLCLSSHWVLFYVDIKEKKFSWLDPDPSSIILSYHFENHVKVLLQWFTSFLLPKLGYSDANKWPFIVRNDIPKQKKVSIILYLHTVDCEIFVMKYGDCLTHGDYFPFKQEDMIHFRRRIFLDIYRGRLHKKINND
ncbi:hypothetical protein V6Z12_A02G013100 [Gossypium hirsutum]